MKLLLTSYTWKWRLFPTLESYKDVPAFMRPTDVQNSTLHPISIDYLPWPSLRDYICLNQNTDARHRVSLYLECIQFDWPADQDLLCKHAGTGVDIHSGFENAVVEANNWKLDESWKDAFPHLRELVT